MKKLLLISFYILHLNSYILTAQSIKYDYGVYPPPSPPALPAKGNSFTDPTFGTSILRVTDASDGANNHHSYSYWPCINKNSSLLYVSSAGGSPTLYDFDTTNFTITNKRPLFASNPPSSGAPSSEDAIWSGMQNDVMLCHTAQKIWSYNVTSNTWTLIKDLSSTYPNLFLSQMSRSLNDDVFAFTYKENVNYTSVGWITYKVSTNQTDTANLAGLDEVQVDKTGNYLVVKTGNSGPSVIEVQIVNLQNGNVQYLTDNGPDYSPGHSDNGTGFVIGADNWNNQHNFRALATPHTWYPVLQYGNDWSHSDHVSMLADNESWMLMSAYKANNLSSFGIFENEIFQVATDGSFSVRRLAHHQSDVQNGNDPYWSSPAPALAAMASMLCSLPTGAAPRAPMCSCSRYLCRSPLAWKS